MKTILQLKKLLIIPLLFLVGNVWGQTILPNFTDYDQVGQSWSNLPLGNNLPGSIYTINDWGCYMVSATMLIKYSGIDVTPVEVNNWLATKNWANSFNQSRVTQYPGSTFITNGSSTNFSASTLKWNIDNGNPIIVGVTNHFMVIKGYNNSGSVMSDFIVSNPALSYDTNLSYYDGNTTQPVGTYTNILKYYFFKNFIQTLPLNQNLTIYGGSVINPKPFYLYFKEADLGNYNFATSMVSNMKIEGMGNNVVPNSRIVDDEYINVDGVGWRKLKIQLQIADLALINNAHEGRTISFDLTVGGVTKKYQNDQLYFADYQDTSSTFTDINDLNNWVETYVRKGANLGLFKGTSLQTFNPLGTLQKQHAAKIIVEAGVRLGLLNIDTSTSNGTFTDVSQSSEFYKHIQTLRNYGYITSGTNFNPTNAITIGQLCKLLVNVFEISDTDIAPTNFINLSQRKIVPISTDATLIPYMTKILRLVDIRENTPGFFFTENLWDFLDFSSVNAVLTGQIQVNGSNTISRGIMAKLITNIMIWKANKMNLTMFRSSNSTMNTQSLDDYISLGEKYDNASITASSSPVTPTQQTYSCASGGSITILYNPGSLPQHYYWSMKKNGATLTSNNSAHSSVTFTAPTVTTPTQWKLYTYTANNKGKARETYITINVGGSSGGNDAHPTVQATNLQVTINNNQTNYIGLSWTRGNGQNCMVTATPLPNSESLPVDGETYTHNQNFQLAPSIGNTKIVYQSTANSANIINLTQDVNYKFTVYEYNGTNYNVTNAPSIVAKLDPLPPYTVAIQQSENTVLVGQSVTFCVESNGNCNTVWTNSGGNATSNGNSCQDVIFNTAGTYTISVVATECGTNATDSDSITITVYSPSQLEPDFIVQNLTSNKASASVGNSITVNYSVTNIGLVLGYLTDMSYYISNDNSLSADDILVLNDPFNTSYQISPNNSISLSKTFSVPSSVSLGNKFIIIKADGQGNETETNENNNTASIALNVVNSLPDLIITNATLPNGTTYASGVAVPINLSVGNSGTINNYLQCYFDVFLSTNGDLTNPNNWNEAVYHLGTDIYPQNLTLNPVFPSSLPSGTYTVFVVVDQAYNNNSNNLIAELNETNNTYTVGTITISNPNQPTIQVSNATITNKTSNSVTLNWTNGNGNNRLVLARESQKIYKDPLDNATYTANTDFSNAAIYESAKVVYNGNGNSVTITGLTAGKTYFFNIYEYKTTGSNIDYLQFKPQKVITHLDNLTIPNWEQITAEYEGFGNVNILNNQIKILSIGGEGRMIKSNSDGNYFNEVNYLKGNSQELGGSNDSKVSFINNNVGYAVRSTKILKTTDGGNNWISQNINLYGNKYLSNLYFIDENNGYLCSRGYGSDTTGVIYKTTDGGNNWNAIYFTNFRIRSIRFINNQIGVCVGENGKIFNTNNSGNTWVEKSVSLGSYTSLSLRDVYFLDNNNIIVVGYSNSNGLIYRSNNAGNSWTNVLTTPDLYQFGQLDFKNNSIGYASPQATNGITANYLYKTLDGGTTWNQFTIPTSDISYDIVLNNSELWLTTKGTSSWVYSIYKYTEPAVPNAISINNNSTNICATQTLSISYDITGTYNSGNIFNVQLSDASGSFSNPLMINSFTNTGSGNLDCILPQSLTIGNYKTRIVSTNPVSISNETNSINISNALSTAISITPETSTICPNQSLTFTATPTNGGTAPTYTWKKNGVVVGSNSATYTDNSLTNGDIVWAEIVSNQACASSVPVASTPTTIQVTQIDELFIQAIDNILAASTDVGVQWIRNGQPIAGATSQFYEATQTGFYQFSVTVGGCTVLSPIHQLTTLGTDDNIFTDNTLSVYPNPTNGVLNIKTNDSNLSQLTLIDLHGRIILQQKATGDTSQLHLESLPSAVYLLKIETENGSQTLKIVKK